MNVVTRLEIADCIENAFGSHPCSRDDLIDYASGHGARSQVIQVLGRLHESTYRELRDLWTELGDVPIDR